MRIALVNLCKTEDFKDHKSYQDSIDFLHENNIDFIDFASGIRSVDEMIESFHKALDSDASLVWVIRGGNKCIQTINKINWNKVVESKKLFYGLSDFTHFSTKAVSKGAICYYGQGLTNIKSYFPNSSERQFIADFLVSGTPVSENPTALANSKSDLSISDEKIIGGHLQIFTLMQSQLKVDLKDRFVFIEYHTGAVGEDLEDLGYYIDQLLYVLKDNMPKGFILGRTEMRNFDNSQISIDEINEYSSLKIAKTGLPVYYLDHFKNTITFK